MASVVFDVNLDDELLEKYRKLESSQIGSPQQAAKRD